MIKRTVLLRAAACLLMAVLPGIVLSGCWNPFAPAGGGGGPGVTYEFKVRETPEDVIHNLTTAYIYGDPNEYLDCMAEEFTFFLNPEDINEDPTLPRYWGKGTEDTIAYNMLGDDSDVERIELTLTQFGQPVENASLPGAWDYNYNVDLRVHIPVNTILHANTGATYTFQVDDQVGPQGQELWEIRWWYDVDKFAKALPPGGNEELVSWTELKNMFRR